MHDSTHLSARFAEGVLLCRAKCEKIAEYEAGVLEAEILAMVQPSEPRVALDMASVQLIASVGLGFLISVQKKLKGRKGKIVLFNVQPGIRQVLKITRLDSGLAICADEAAAIKASK